MQAMGLGLDWILLVADQIGQWPGALRPVKAPVPLVLPLIGLAGALACGARGGARLVAVLPAGVAIALWGTSPRPQVLISDQGTLVGVWTEGARALSRDKGAAFVARNWLENDGSTRDQWQSAQLWPGKREKLRASTVVNGAEILHLRGKTQAKAFTDCTTDQVIVSDKWIHARGGCLVFDTGYLRQSGSVALNWQGGNWEITTAAQLVGDRLWAQ
jgi:competence protein ComEC